MRIPFALERFLPNWLFSRFRMRSDWDLRARENPLYFIDCGHADTPAVFWESGETDVAKLILRGVDLRADAAILEIGCGIGRLLRPFLDRATRIVGVDISGEMVARAREVFRADPRVEIYRSRGTLSRTESRSIDFVFSFIVFQHIPSKAAVYRYFAEAARVLRAGGIFRFQVDGRTRTARARPDSWNGARIGGPEATRELQRLGFSVLDLTAADTQYMWVTARYDRGQDQRPTQEVAFQPRNWRLSALSALVSRLGYDPESEVPRIVSGELAIRDLAEPYVVASQSVQPALYVAGAYETILGRAADPEGLQFYTREIQNGIERTNVVDCLIASPEFDDRYRRQSD